jgi:hypothetical protein
MPKKSPKEKVMDAMIGEFVKRYPDITEDDAVHALSEIGDYGAVKDIIGAYWAESDMTDEHTVTNYLDLGKMIKTKYHESEFLDMAGELFESMCAKRMKGVKRDKKRDFLVEYDAEDYRFVLDNYCLLDKLRDDLPEEVVKKVSGYFDRYMEMSHKPGIFGGQEPKGVTCLIYDGDRPAEALVAKKRYKMVIKALNMRIEGSAIVEMYFRVKNVIKGLSVSYDLGLRSEGGKIVKIPESEMDPCPAFHTIYFPAQAEFRPDTNSSEIVAGNFFVEHREILEHSISVGNIYVAEPVRKKGE